MVMVLNGKQPKWYQDAVQAMEADQKADLEARVAIYQKRLNMLIRRLGLIIGQDEMQRILANEEPASRPDRLRDGNYEFYCQQINHSDIELYITRVPLDDQQQNIPSRQFYNQATLAYAITEIDCEYEVPPEDLIYVPIPDLPETTQAAIGYMQYVISCAESGNSLNPEKRLLLALAEFLEKSDEEDEWQR